MGLYSGLSKKPLIFNIYSSSKDIATDGCVKKKKEKHIKKKKQPYTELREADIMWSRKIWREIDLRQKINHPFYYPKNDGSGSRTQDRMSLIDVIYSAAQEGAIKCYNPSNGDDEFRQEMSQQELRNIGSAKEVYEDVLDTALYNQGVPIAQATKKQLVQLPVF